MQSAAASQNAGSTIGPDGLEQHTYNKLYKQLGTKNNNKDVRQLVQQRLNGNIEDTVSAHF